MQLLEQDLPLHGEREPRESKAWRPPLKPARGHRGHVLRLGPDELNTPKDASPDLRSELPEQDGNHPEAKPVPKRVQGAVRSILPVAQAAGPGPLLDLAPRDLQQRPDDPEREIGRASCRERV